jgi:hypothetical protein
MNNIETQNLEELAKVQKQINAILDDLKQLPKISELRNISGTHQTKLRHIVAEKLAHLYLIEGETTISIAERPEVDTTPRMVHYYITKILPKTNNEELNNRVTDKRLGMINSPTLILKVAKTYVQTKSTTKTAKIHKVTYNQIAVMLKSEILKEEDELLFNKCQALLKINYKKGAPKRKQENVLG